MKTYKACGIVLHSVRYGENAMIVYMLTNLYGRQAYMVQGVRGGRNKGNKAALFQPMFIVDFVGLESSKMELHRIKEIKSGMTLKSIPFQVRKSTISLFMAEVLYRIVKEIEPNSPLFDFIYASVEALDNINEGVANFHLWFLVRLSSYLGFYPGNEFIPGCLFDIPEGIFSPILPCHSMYFDQQNTTLLNTIMESEVTALSEIKLTREQRSVFMESVLSYFGYHLDSIKQVKSIQILKEVF